MYARVFLFELIIYFQVIQDRIANTQNKAEISLITQKELYGCSLSEDNIYYMVLKVMSFTNDSYLLLNQITLYNTNPNLLSLDFT